MALQLRVPWYKTLYAESVPEPTLIPDADIMDIAAAGDYVRYWQGAWKMSGTVVDVRCDEDRLIVRWQNGMLRSVPASEVYGLLKREALVFPAESPLGSTSAR